MYFTIFIKKHPHSSTLFFLITSWGLAPPPPPIRDTASGLPIPLLWEDCTHRPKLLWASEPLKPCKRSPTVSHTAHREGQHRSRLASYSKLQNALRNVSSNVPFNFPCKTPARTKLFTAHFDALAPSDPSRTSWLQYHSCTGARAFPRHFKGGGRRLNPGSSIHNPYLNATLKNKKSIDNLFPLTFKEEKRKPGNQLWVFSHCLNRYPEMLSVKSTAWGYVMRAWITIAISLQRTWSKIDINKLKALKHSYMDLKEQNTC